MNLIEDFKNFLSSFTGLTDRLEKVSTDLSNALATINEKDGQIQSLTKEKSDLESKISTLPTQEALDAEKLRADTAEKAKTDLEASLPQKINDEAAKIVASNGHAPVATATKAAEEQKPGEGLTGLAKATAIHKAQNSKK